ncbi:hypothetical protein DV735_g3287, partial [Chaetothyriales sp. CBS 134920]
MSISSDPVQLVIEAMDKTTIRPEWQLPIRTVAVHDSKPADGTTTVAATPARTSTTTYPARKSSRQDGLDRREMLLRGKEGSRQRRRWENDRLLSNPWAQPPLPSDWEVRPTHPIRNIPYYLAPLWEAAELQRAVESRLRGRKNSRTIRPRRHNGLKRTGSLDEAAAMVPKELRARLKHNRSAKWLLQDLEEEVRAFVRQWQQQWQQSEASSRDKEGHDIPLTSDSEDDDTVVFAGRGAATHAARRREPKDKSNKWDAKVSNEKLVFEGADGDRGAGFARWLVHCVGSYYGLRTWSVTTQAEGAESRRQAYVGVDHRSRPIIARGLDGNRDVELPFPLWGMVDAGSVIKPWQKKSSDYHNISSKEDCVRPNNDDPRSSVETYASTVASDKDLDEIPEYELPRERPHVHAPDAIPSTASDFNKLFPTTRRILIQHDDSTPDGNMNLRLDTEAVSQDGKVLKMTLFHLRMKNLHERQFSLRRYCRDSGREICSSKKKYTKPVPPSLQQRRSSITRPLGAALQMIGIKSRLGLSPTIPTNVIRLEFSNYAQVEVHRLRQDRIKRYDFEYWGEPYTWRREISYDEDEAVYAYELINLASGKGIACITQDKLDSWQTWIEETQGGWIPPSSLRIREKTVPEDLGDVIVATGLIALVDDCIKRHWHGAHSARAHKPTKSRGSYVEADRVADELARRHGRSRTA